MKVCVVLLLFSVSATVLAQDDIEFGFRGGFWVPTGSWISGSYSTSPVLGANLVIHGPQSNIESNLSFVHLRDNMNVDDYSGSIVNISLGLGQYFGDFHLGAGWALYLVSERFNDSEYGDYDETSDMGGTYWCAGTRMMLWGQNMEIEASYHLVDYAFAKGWLAISTIVRI